MLNIDIYIVVYTEISLLVVQQRLNDYTSDIRETNAHGVVIENVVFGMRSTTFGSGGNMNLWSCTLGYN